MASHSSPSPRRPPRRGDGVPPLPPPGVLLAPVPEPDDPTGRRPFDFGGPIWRWTFIGAAVALVAALVGPAIGAAYLVAEGRPVAEYLAAMQDWTVKVVIGLIVLGVGYVARRQGTTQRSQKTTSDNVFATASRVDVIARHVDGGDRRIDEMATELAALRQAVTGLTAGAVDSGAASKVDAAVGRLSQLLDFAGRTGPLAVTPARAAAPDAPQLPQPDLYVEDPDPEPEPEPERPGASVWGPAGRPAWAETGTAPPRAETDADALAALLGRPRSATSRPATWTEIVRTVDAIDADEAHRRLD